MTIHPSVILASSSVAIFAGVQITATALAPNDARPMLLLCGVFAMGAAVQSAARDPAALTSALLISLTPVIALLAEDSPTWLIGPLGALLLVAGELNALSWEFRGTGLIGALTRRRLLSIGELGVLGLAASLAVGAVGWGPLLGGTSTVVVAASALAALAWVIFGRSS